MGCRVWGLGLRVYETAPAIVSSRSCTAGLLPVVKDVVFCVYGLGFRV